jgi:hypothetical protein
MMQRYVVVTIAREATERATTTTKRSEKRRR